MGLVNTISAIMDVWLRVAVLATKFTTINMEKILKINMICVTAKGLLNNTLPPEPICTCSIVMAKKGNKKKTKQVTIKDGWRVK